MKDLLKKISRYFKKEEPKKEEPKKEEVGRVVGVCWSKPNNKWKAYIKIDGKQKHLGYFDNKEDAIAARKEAEELLLYKRCYKD